MCSIGGFVSNRPLPAWQARELCRGLLWYGQDRGSQSSGVYINGRVAKRAMSPTSFIDSEAFANATRHPADMALTHTRQPTCGGLGDKQAQPFRVADTISVHNGMLFDLPALRRQWDLVKTSGVDSELIARFVDRYNIKRLPEFVDSTLGMSAIACINGGHLYLLRDDNPIVACTMRLQDGNSLTVFGSETRQVMAALGHVWLVPPGYRAESVAERVLIKVSGNGINPIGMPYNKKYHGVYDFDCPAYSLDGTKVYQGASTWDRERWNEFENRKTWKERKRDRRLRKAMQRGGELHLGIDTRRALPAPEGEGQS